MESVNDALKYVVQAKNLLSKPWDEKMIEEMFDLLNKAEEALATSKQEGYQSWLRYVRSGDSIDASRVALLVVLIA